MLKSQDVGLSRTWAVRKRHAGFYTGGKVQLARSGAFMACMYEGSVSIVRAADGVLVKRISAPQGGEGGEQFTCFVLHPNDRDLVTVSQNQLLRHWDAKTGQCKRSFKVHAAPVVAMGMDPTGTLVATGSADRTCKVWDLEKGYCTHNFTGHKGSVKVVEFHPDPHRLLLVTGGDDCHVRVWDLATSSCAAHFTQHMATVTAVAFSPSGWTLLTAGRDKVVNVFSLRANRHLTTILAHEALEAVAVLPAELAAAVAGAHGAAPADESAADHVYFATAGERGRVRVWRLTSRVQAVRDEEAGGEKQVLRLEGTQVAEEGARRVPQKGTHLFFAEPKEHAWGSGRAAPPHLLVVTEDQHVLHVTLPALGRGAHLVGFNDDVIDAAYVPGSWSDSGQLADRAAAAAHGGAGPEAEAALSGRVAAAPPRAVGSRRGAVRKLPAPTGLVAFASNSPAVRLLDVATFSCDLLAGHRDIVLGVDVSPDGRWLATASKDNTARVWCLRTRVCVAELAGHTGSVSAVAFSRKPGTYAASYARAAGIRRKLKHRAEQAHAARRKAGAGLATEARSRIAEEAQAAIAALGRDAAQQGGQGGARAVGVINQEGGIAVGAGPFLVTTSEDKTVKLWSLAEICALFDDPSDDLVGMVAGEDRILRPKAHLNVLAHAKDVNDAAVAPNDRMFATASQDRSVKLWSPDALHLLGELKGHRRGVWSVAFSPVDRVAATASGDRTVKLWSVVDMSCLRTFEGHTATVLRVQFVTAGLQLLSSGADGLLKLWTVRTNECANTFDAHGDKAWALAVRGDGRQVITGGSDSIINVWQDCTHQEVEAEVQKKEKELLLEQDLLNAMRLKEHKRAITLAFELDQPMRLLSIFESLIGAVLADEVEAEAEARLAYGSEGMGVAAPAAEEIEELAAELRGAGATAHDIEAQVKGERLARSVLSRPLQVPAPAALREALAGLSPKQLSKCMHYVREWNTNAKHAFVAQTVFRLMVETWPLRSLLRTRDLPKVLDAFASYTQRHFQRAERLLQSSYMVDYALSGMRKLVPEADAGGDAEEGEAERGSSELDAARALLGAADRSSLDMLAALELSLPDGAEEARSGGGYAGSGHHLVHGGWEDESGDAAATAGDAGGDADQGPGAAAAPDLTAAPVTPSAREAPSKKGRGPAEKGKQSKGVAKRSRKAPTDKVQRHAKRARKK